MQDKNNLRMTRQRQVILDELRNGHHHPSADEIYDLVRTHLPRISLGTVYRNLDVLCEMGEIQKLPVGGPVKRYDGNPNKHYHIRCLKCNRVEDAPVAPLQSIENELYQSTIFEIIGHNLEFIGYCPGCSENGNTGPLPE